jgi:molybdopterin-guanine dinucleotide biosynthesis protein A
VSILAVELLAQSGKIAHPSALSLAALPLAALPLAHWFLNVNAPADLRRASAIRAGRVS